MRKRIVSALLSIVLLVGILPLRANAVNQLSASNACIEMIKQIEGFHAIPYWDYAQWSVGFGTACPQGDLQRYQQEGIPIEEAEALLQMHIQNFNREVNRFMVRHNLQLTQQQFDALFSLSYNLGAAWMYDTNSKLVQAILMGITGNELIYLMGLRNKAGGVFNQGLFRRRMMEADLYLNGRYNTSMPADYGVVYYDSGSGNCEATIQGYDMNLPAQPLAVPTYEGYDFLGWFTQAEGGVPVTELNAFTNGMTLYAHWEKIGAAENISGTAISPVVVTVQTSLLYVRIGPGTTYRASDIVTAGTELTITALTTRNSALWGKCSLGWISLAHTDYQSKNSDSSDNTSQLKLPVGATIMGESVTIYNGPHTSYPQRGTLQQTQQIQVLELRTTLGQQWARFENGWIRVDRNMMLHDESYLAHSFVATVTNSYLNVRNGPGTTYTLAGTLQQGEQVLILAITMVDGTPWGRCYKGWISLTYTDLDKSMLPRYQNHTYGAWTELEPSTCTVHGLQRHQCLDCDREETQSAELKPHTFGEWKKIKAPTETEPGLQQRQCQLCGYEEQQVIDCLQPPSKVVYGTVTGCDVLNVRSGAGAENAWVGSLKRGDRVEIFEQVTVNGKVWGRGEKGWFCITGYVSLEVLDPGETAPRVMYVTAYQLNIRSGPGAYYLVVGVLSQGDRVEVLETQMVDGTLWARIDRGWVSTKYLK